MVLQTLIKVLSLPFSWSVSSPSWSSPPEPFSPSPLRCLRYHRGWSACFLAFLLNYSLQWPAGETCLSSITLTRSPHFTLCEKKKKKRGQHQPSVHRNSKTECRGNKRVPPTSLQGPSPNTSGGGVAGASPPPQRDHRGENKLGRLSPGASCREQREEREIEEGRREGGVCMRAGPGFPYLLIVLLDGCPKTVMWKRIDGLRGREGTTLCSSWSRHATHRPPWFLQITFYWHDCSALVISLCCSWQRLSLSACTWILSRNISQWRDTFSLLGRLVSHQTLGRNITAFFSCDITMHITYHHSLTHLSAHRCPETAIFWTKHNVFPQTRLTPGVPRNPLDCYGHMWFHTARHITVTGLPFCKTWNMPSWMWMQLWTCGDSLHSYMYENAQVII